jgi:DNA-binding SARP family transcriptional activator
LEAVEFRLLGPLEVRDGDRVLPIRGAKERAVLALLLLEANHFVSSERLIDELWPDSPPETAKNSLQVRVSHLRTALGSGSTAIASQAAGYVIRTESGQLDLEHFERLIEDGDDALLTGDPAVAAERLRAALALWRGPPLAEFTAEPFARVAAARLEELGLLALEKRIEAELLLGRHATLVPELETLVAEHPLREQLRALLARALYAGGRQADALATLTAFRRELVEELGLEPGPALRELERNILRQDPGLATTVPATNRAILVAALNESALESLLSIAATLARRPAHDLIVVMPLAADADLAAATRLLRLRREALVAEGLQVRVAAFTSAEKGADLVKIATEQDVDLVLVDAPPALAADAELDALVTGAPCDVGVVVPRELASAGPVLVPFTGDDHDWAAVELGSWFAGSRQTTLTIAGTTADDAAGARDASLLLADASLAVQRALGVTAEPLLLDPTPEQLVLAARDAALVVLGVPERRLRGGLGPVRAALVRDATVPVLLVRRGARPGGLAPRSSETRFTWSLRVS